MIKNEVSNRTLISRDALFKNEGNFNAEISPDGKYISYIKSKDDKIAIYVADSKDLSNEHAITDDYESVKLNYFWPFDSSCIIFTKADNTSQILYKALINEGSIKVNRLTEAGKLSCLLSKNKNYPDQILIGSYGNSNKFFDVYKINITDEKIDLIYENHHFVGFEIGEDLTLKIGICPQPDLVDAMFDLSDLSKPKFLSKISDAKELEISLDDLKSKYQDQDKKLELDFIKKKFDKNVTIIENSKTLTGDLSILEVFSSNASTEYYKYDYILSELKFLFSCGIQFEESDLVKMTPVIINTRDGLKMPCLLSLPKDIKIDPKYELNKILENPLPMILSIHGGPMRVFQKWQFSIEHQFFANRGYAVLSVNYRGSGDFTAKLLNEGYGQWGDKMLDDMIDAVNWAIDNNIAIKDKIAIFGGSYGGYAALAHLAFNPEVFACAISINGPSNLNTILYGNYGILEEWTKIIGSSINTPQGKNFTFKRSPVNFVSNITKPLLIINGAQDIRIPISDSEKMVQAMKQHNIPVTFMKFPDEGHVFFNDNNQKALFAIAENFFQQHLAGDAEPLGKVLKDSSIIIVEKGDMDILGDV